INVLITTSRMLTETARLLQQYYYFYKIPETWIEIPKNDNNILKILLSLEEFNTYMSNQPEEITALFPVNSHDKLPQVIKFLLEQFNTTSLPAYVNQLTDLPIS